MLRDPTFTTPFTDPYEGQHNGRMSFDVVRSEWAWFHFLDNTPRSREIMLSILLYKLKNELKRIGINEYNPTAFKLAVAGCTITCPDVFNGQPSLPGGTPVDSRPTKTPDRDDRRGVGSIPQLSPATPPQPTSPQSPHGGSDKGTSGKCKGKVGKRKVGEV